jgi:hypothetical protein
MYRLHELRILVTFKMWEYVFWQLVTNIAKARSICLFRSNSRKKSKGTDTHCLFRKWVLLMTIDVEVLTAVY